MAGAAVGGEGEQAVEHGGDHVGVGDTVPGDQDQRLDRVPLLHHHHGYAVGEGQRNREGEGGGVVERSGAEMDVGAVPVVLVVATEVSVGQRTLGTGRAVDALGAPRRARRVQHLAAEDRIRDVGPVLGRHRPVVRLEAGQTPAY